MAIKAWLVNKSTTPHTYSNKFNKNYFKQKVNRTSYPAKFIPKLVANYPEQFL